MTVPTEMDNDELIKRLDSAVQKDPHRVILAFQDYQSKHTRRALKRFGRYIKQFEDFYGWIVESLEYVNFFPKQKWPEHRATQYIIMVDNLSTLYCAFDLLVRGHYFEANILLRTVYEGVIKVLYLTYNPNDAFAPLLSSSRKGIKQFQLETFLRHELKIDWSSIWRIASGISHSNNIKVLFRLLDITRGKIPGRVSLELKWDEKNFSLPINLSMFCLWLYYVEYLVLFATPKPDELPENYYEKILEIETLLGAWANSSPNMYSQMFTDVERIKKEFITRESTDFLSIRRLELISVIRNIKP